MRKSLEIGESIEIIYRVEDGLEKELQRDEKEFMELSNIVERYNSLLRNV